MTSTTPAARRPRDPRPRALRLDGPRRARRCCIASRPSRSRTSARAARAPRCSATSAAGCCTARSVAVTRTARCGCCATTRRAAELVAFVDRHVFREDVRIEEPPAARRARRRRSDSASPPGTCDERTACRGGRSSTQDFGMVELGEPRPSDPGGRARARIRAGRPRHGHEIAEAFNPFEVGLAHEVHLSKGCFTGQEALLRLITYRERAATARAGRRRGAPPADARDADPRRRARRACSPASPRTARAGSASRCSTGGMRSSDGDLDARSTGATLERPAVSFPRRVPLGCRGRLVYASAAAPPRLRPSSSSSSATSTTIASVVSTSDADAGGVLQRAARDLGGVEDAACAPGRRTRRSSAS